MMYKLTLLTNEILSYRSMKSYGQKSLFSIDVGKCQHKAVHDANKGLLEAYDTNFRDGMRTIPRGNDANWEIGSVFQFNRRSDAYHAARVVKFCSKTPSLLQDITKEIIMCETSRNVFLDDPYIRWNGTKSIRFTYFDVRHAWCFMPIFTTLGIDHKFN